MDYIIIQKNGNPLTFLSGFTIPYSDSKKGTIIVYGDKEDAENDFNEEEDLGIAQLAYENIGKNCIVKVSFDGKEIGEFVHGFHDETDFQEKLWDFIILHDFVTKQLPH